jgi:hypothetical protein
MKNYVLLVVFLAFFLKFTTENAIVKDNSLIKVKEIKNEKDLSEIEKQIELLKESIKQLNNSKKGGKLN